MEMIVCILFFSLSAAVSAQMFAKSHMISNTAIKENHAVIEVNNLAECFYMEYGDPSAIGEKDYYEHKAYSTHVFDVWFDENFCETDAFGPDALYCLQLYVKDVSATDMRHGKITFSEMIPYTDGFNEIYSLDVTVNVPNTISMINDPEQ